MITIPMESQQSKDNTNLDSNKQNGQVPDPENPEQNGSTANKTPVKIGLDQSDSQLHSLDETTNGKVPRKKAVLDLNVITRK